MIKVCSKCKKEKAIQDFSKNKSRKDGLAHYCKPCASEQIGTLRKNRAASYLPKARYYTALRRARKKQATPAWADLEIIKDFI